MEFSFSNIPLVISMALGALIIVLHFVSVLFDCAIAKWLSYINVILHVVATFTMLYAGSTIDLLVLCYMISILVCCSIYYVSYTRKLKKAKEAPVEPDVAEAVTEAIEENPSDESGEKEEVV